MASLPTDELWTNDWINIENTCLLIVRGKKGESVGLDNDVENLSILFKNMPQIILLDDGQPQPELNELLRDLVKTYAKIIFIYTGHASNEESNLNAQHQGNSRNNQKFYFGNRHYDVYSLNQSFKNFGFVLSLFIANFCNEVPKSESSGHRDLFLASICSEITPLNLTDLNYMLNQRGHIIIRTTEFGKKALCDDDIGTFFFLAWINSQYKNKSGFLMNTISANATLLSCGYETARIVDGFLIDLEKTDSDKYFILCSKSSKKLPDPGIKIPSLAEKNSRSEYGLI